MSALLAVVETTGNTGEQIVFWVCAFFAVGGALGMLMSRRAVHSALFIATDDDRAGRALRRPAGTVPRHGAGGRLHRRRDDAVPVRAHDRRRRLLRLAGRDDQGPAHRRDRLRRRLRRACSWPASAEATINAVGLDAANAADGGNVQGIARLIFGRYVLAFEVTSALLITAALGAMVLAHRERIVPAPDAARALRGEGALGHSAATCPAPACTPGTTRSALPALLPDGTPTDRIGARAAARRQRARRRRPRRHGQRVNAIAAGDAVSPDARTRRTQA